MSKKDKNHFLSMAGMTLFSAYLLSFVFEGQVLYRIISNFAYKPSLYVLIGISSHFLGLILAGALFKSFLDSRKFILTNMGLSLLATVPFFFKAPILWGLGLVVSGLCGGVIIASYGYFLRNFFEGEQRTRAIANLLIYSNLIMVFIDIISINISASSSLFLSIFPLILSMTFIGKISDWEGDFYKMEKGIKESQDLKKATIILFIFVTVITINSGLMYQVMNPNFGDLPLLVSFYWALPYIIVILLMKRLPGKVNRSLFLYLGMAMKMAAFIFFMLLGRMSKDYIVINTLMMGACGIFDLFWWSIIGEILDYVKNPVKIFGLGLAANVLGILLGDIIGVYFIHLQIATAKVTVLALVIISLAIAILPFLNHHLTRQLKSHIFLLSYEDRDKTKIDNVIEGPKLLSPLTEREKEVLKLILEGKSNREIAKVLYISESTVKTHAGNIYSKYNVSRRTELISSLLGKYPRSHT